MFDFTFVKFAGAFAGGVLPTFFWLWFWLRSDEHPEPPTLVTLAFIAGAITVPLIIPIQNWVYLQLIDSPLGLVSVAGIEELAKFAVVALLVFPTRYVDEPMDYGIYLITGALGFASLENMLFLVNPLQDTNAALTIATGNLRFLGATLLHAVSAAVVGVSMGVVFYKSRTVKFIYTILGITAAVLLHALFNFFIMSPDTKYILATLAILWAIAIIVVFMFRKLNQLYRTH